MSVRLERILNRLATQRAPHLLIPGWSTHLDKLARLLAEHDLLILSATIPQGLMNAKDQHIQQWVTAYARFYTLIAQPLFPSFSQIQARYADEQMPPIVLLEGQATAVIEAMAGFVVPYVAARQKQTVADAELQVLMHVVLEEELMCDNLPRPQYNQLAQEGVAILRQLLTLPVYQVSLTEFDRQIFQMMPQKPPSLPTRPAGLPTTAPLAQAAPPQPEPAPPQNGAKPPESAKHDLEMLDETDTGSMTPTERLFTKPIPTSPPNPMPPKRRPPVPDLPNKDS